MLMLTHANLLVLDEPTNHLDVETIEVLEDAIEGYEGTVILVSHDRAMLRALATKVVGSPRASHHRIRRQLRGVGGGERREGARGLGEGGGGGRSPARGREEAHGAA
jgi:ABC-type nitrate/sulfonate/bicarbonate transport system ATPase subunit